MKEDVSKEIQVENARFIRCPDCGEEIMMIPILGQMIEAIENHLSTHKDRADLPKHDLLMPHPRAPNLEEDLAEQVLTRAAEISDALGKNSTWINRQ
jgi:hypothetical protein